MSYPTTRTAATAQFSDFSSLTDLFANLLPGDTCYLPQGSIPASSDYVRSAPMSLKGSGIYGAGGAVINYTGSGTFLTCDTSSSGLLLEDFRIAGTSTMQKGVFLNGINNQINLNRLFIEGNNSGCGTALALQEVYDANITNGTYRYCSIGICANNLGINKTVNNLNIINNNLQNNITGICWDSGFGGNIAGNDFSGCGIALDLGNGLSAGQSLEAINIGSNYCEATTYARIGYNANANTNVRSINISGGYLECTGDYIHLYVCNKVSISGVRFGSLNAGKKHIIIESTAQNTTIDVPDLDPANVTDNSNSTIYAPHLMSSLLATLNSNQSVPYNTYTTVAYDTVVRSRYITWDATNHRATPLRKGWYKIEAQCSIGSMSDQKNIFIGLFQNGNRVAGNDAYSSGSASTLSISASNILYFNGSTDYIEAKVVQKEGVGIARTLTGDPAFTFMSITAV